MIKVLAPAIKNPERRTLGEFHHYWATSHGPLFTNTRALRRYVQHLTLPEAYEGDPGQRVLYDGVSMFWYDDLDAMRNPGDDPADVALRNAVRADDRQLFDRGDDWPISHKSASVVAEEKVIIDGETAPGMVKAISAASRLPGLTHEQFFKYWQESHGPLMRRCPGVRRYVQNHALTEAYAFRGMTHDGWSEVWFDDIESLHAARQTQEWAEMSADGATLFARPMGFTIARELVQKEFGQTPRRWAEGMSEADVRATLEKQGYRGLAASDAPAKILAADAAGLLAVWTDEHLVMIDGSGIDARPGG